MSTQARLPNGESEQASLPASMRLSANRRQLPPATLLRMHAADPLSGEFLHLVSFRIREPSAGNPACCCRFNSSRSLTLPARQGSSRDGCGRPSCLVLLGSGTVQRSASILPHIADRANPGRSAAPRGSRSPEQLFLLLPTSALDARTPSPPQVDLPLVLRRQPNFNLNTTGAPRGWRWDGLREHGARLQQQLRVLAQSVANAGHQPH